MDASENSALMSLSLLHERFLAREALDCGGRESELDAILTSLKSEGQPGMRPMLWQGARGVGKSALLAEAARRVGGMEDQFNLFGVPFPQPSTVIPFLPVHAHRLAVRA